MAEAQPGEPGAETNSTKSRSSVHGRILELLKQDVVKTSAKPKAAIAPFLNPDSTSNDQPVAEGVLELEPIKVTEKKPVEIPPHPPKLTLNNFFYGEGAIWKNGDGTRTLSIGPEGHGLAAIKFTLKL